VKGRVLDYIFNSSTEVFLRNYQTASFYCQDFAFVLCLNLFQNYSLASNLDINSFKESAGDYFASGTKVLYRAFEHYGRVRFGDF